MTTTFDKVDAETYHQWLNHRDLWTIAEGIQLFIGAPEKDFDVETRRQAGELLARAERAVISGRLCPHSQNELASKDIRKIFVLPLEFVRWLGYELDCDIPDGLLPLRFMAGARHIAKHYEALDRVATAGSPMRHVLDMFKADSSDEHQDESRDEDAELGKRTRERMVAMATSSQNRSEVADNYWKPFIEERDELIRKGKNKSQASHIVSDRHPEKEINPGTLRQK